MNKDSLKQSILRLLRAVAFVVFNLILAEVTLRLFFPVSDLPVSTYDPEVGLHLGPNQTGTWVVGATGEAQGRYHINADGWNSVHEYATRPSGTLRIAVIGDSFVEALQVDVDRAFPTLLERNLQTDPACAHFGNIEVYSFGYSGASLAQILSMMRYAARRYQPDVFVINIHVTDFAPAIFSPYPHFLHYRQNSQGGFEEVPPIPYEPSRIRRIMLNSALVRYLYLNLNLSPPQFRDSLSTGLATQPAGDSAEEATDEPPTSEETIADLAGHIFTEYRVTADANQARLLLIVDPDLLAIYAGQPSANTRYGTLSVRLAAERDIPLIDLTTAFADAYSRSPEFFSYAVDGHWNARGHEIVANSIADWMILNVCQTGDAN